jgi:hypothetical protein
MRVFQDDLPSVGVSRLRASGLITPGTTEFIVRLGDVEQTVGVTHRRFPSGGGWSRFVCPSCGANVRMLRLLDCAVVCCRCCTRRGVRCRSEPMSIKQRARRRIPQLRAMLESKTPLRLKPSTLWGTMEKRARLEARLREAEFRVVHGRASSKTTAVEDPCNDPDFVAPKRPWPGSKPR